MLSKNLQLFIVVRPSALALARCAPALCGSPARARCLLFWRGAAPSRRRTRGTGQGSLHSRARPTAPPGVRTRAGETEPARRGRKDAALLRSRGAGAVGAAASCAAAREGSRCCILDPRVPRPAWGGHEQGQQGDALSKRLCWLPKFVERGPMLAVAGRWDTEHRVLLRTRPLSE